MPVNWVKGIVSFPFVFGLLQKHSGVALIYGTADRGTAEPAEPREMILLLLLFYFFYFATYIPGIRIQLISISLLCIDLDFFFFTWFHSMIQWSWFDREVTTLIVGWTREIFKVLHEDLRWRVIHHQYLHGSSIKETDNVLFTSTAFVPKIRKLYRQRGEVNRKRRIIKREEPKEKNNQIISRFRRFRGFHRFRGSAVCSSAD